MGDGPPVMPADDPDAIAAAARCVRDGGLVVLPTDTVYGLAAALDHPAALARIFVAKGRPRDRTLPVLLASPDDLDRVAAGVSARISRLVGRFWPGPLTIVLPARPGLPAAILGEGKTVGVRVPDLASTRAVLLAADGALAVTSANRSGGQPALTALAALAALGTDVDLVLDGGRVAGGVPSTIVRITTDMPEILRLGTLNPEELLGFW